MKLSVMQPYFFPYVGYFQLYYASDRFIFLDNVKFQKKSYVHKNYIGDSSAKVKIQIPLIGASQNKVIRNLMASGHYSWRSKLLKTLFCVYRKAPNFPAVIDLVERAVSGNSISQIAMNSVLETAEYIGIKRETSLASDIALPNESAGENRIIELCKANGSTEYINMYGGRKLYNKQNFLDNGIRLRFLIPVISPYRRARGIFIPSLSIIDALMHESPKAVKEIATRGCLTEYTKFGAIT